MYRKVFIVMVFFITLHVIIYPPLIIRAEEVKKNAWQGKLGDGSVLTEERLRKIIKEHEEWLGSNGQSGKRAKLARADLKFVDLRGAKLSLIDLSMADLRGAILVKVNLKNANLSGAILRSADLSHANLQGANFIKADLRRVRLKRADLTSAQFYKAKLTGVEFTYTDVDRDGNEVWIPAKMNDVGFGAAELNGANFSGAYLNGANFASAHLKGADFSRAYLVKTSFLDADLRGAILRKADLRTAAFGWAKLHEANLEAADLTSASLRSAVLSGASFEHANLCGADMKDAQIDGVKFNSAILRRVFYEPFSKKSAEEKCDIWGVTLANEGNSTPEIHAMATAVGMWEMCYEGCPTGLHLLREAFAEAGYVSQTRQIRHVIKHNIGGVSWHSDLFHIFLEWPTGWGESPLRTIAILCCSIFLFALIYLDGFTDSKPYGIDVRGLTSNVSWKPINFTQCLWFSLYFSIQMALHLSWKDPSTGTWMTRMQPGDTFFVPKGWWRLPVGIQNVIGNYLVALFLLTYFGGLFKD